MAGESAQREYERRRASRQDRIRRRRPAIVAGVVMAFAAGWAVSIAMLSAAMSMVESVATGSDLSVSVHAPPVLVSLAIGLGFAVRTATLMLAPSRAEVAWGKGAGGERVVGHALDALAAEGVRSLHDRSIPGSRANIDHVAVTPTGVFTVDAKRYSGQLEVRARGRELWVNARNRSKLLDQAHRQADIVSKILVGAGLESPVTPVLCFVDTKMPLRLASQRAGGVLLTTPRRLRKHLVQRGVVELDASQASMIVSMLDMALRPAVSSERHGHPPRDVARPASTAAASEPGARAQSCRSCGEPMVERRRRSDGTRFYGCSAFPRCRATHPLE